MLTGTRYRRQGKREIKDVEVGAEDEGSGGMNVEAGMVFAVDERETGERLQQTKDKYGLGGVVRQKKRYGMYRRL